MNLSVKKVLSDIKKIVLIHKFTHSLFIQTLIPRLVSIYLLTMNGPDITFHLRVWDIESISHNLYVNITVGQVKLLLR